MLLHMDLLLEVYTQMCAHEQADMCSNICIPQPCHPGVTLHTDDLWHMH